MEQIKELHRHLFGEEMNFDDKYHHISIDDEYFLMRRKNRCSHEVQKDDQLSKNEIYKNNFFKKNAAIKAPRKKLTIKNKNIILASFIYLFTYLRELKNEAKLAPKGVVFRVMRCSFPRKGVVFRDIKCSFSRKGVVFRDVMRSFYLKGIVLPHIRRIFSPKSGVFPVERCSFPRHKKGHCNVR